MTAISESKGKLYGGGREYKIRTEDTISSGLTHQSFGSILSITGLVRGKKPWASESSSVGGLSFAGASTTYSTKAKTTPDVLQESRVEELIKPTLDSYIAILDLKADEAHSLKKAMVGAVALFARYDSFDQWQFDQKILTDFESTKKPMLSILMAISRETQIHFSAHPEDLEHIQIMTPDQKDQLLRTTLKDLIKNAEQIRQPSESLRESLEEAKSVERLQN